MLHAHPMLKLKTFISLSLFCVSVLAYASDKEVFMQRFSEAFLSNSEASGEVDRLLENSNLDPSQKAQKVWSLLNTVENSHIQRWIIKLIKKSLPTDCTQALTKAVEDQFDNKIVSYLKMIDTSVVLNELDFNISDIEITYSEKIRERLKILRRKIRAYRKDRNSEITFHEIVHRALGFADWCKLEMDRGYKLTKAKENEAFYADIWFITGKEKKDEKWLDLPDFTSVLDVTLDESPQAGTVVFKNADAVLVRNLLQRSRSLNEEALLLNSLQLLNWLLDNRLNGWDIVLINDDDVRFVDITI